MNTIYIKNDYSVSDAGSHIELYKNGDGTKFLSNDGKYKTITIPEVSANSIILEGYQESTEIGEALNLASTDTLNEAFGKLQKAIKDNEEVEAKAMLEFKNSVGLTENVKLPDLSDTHYLNSLTTIVNCLKALDAKVYELEQSLTIKNQE